MDHAVAIRTDEDEVAKAGLDLARRMQRNYVVALDVTLTVRPVRGGEVESTRGAPQRFMCLHVLFDLFVTQPPITLPGEVLALKQPPLRRFVVVQFVDIVRGFARIYEVA